MTWILILWMTHGAQVMGTGDTGSALVTATFQDKEACVNAAVVLKKAESSFGYGCFPSSTGDKAFTGTSVGLKGPVH